VFSGVKLDTAQPMGLPTDVVAVADISKAVCQAVWQQLNGALFVDPATSTASGEVLMERKKLVSLCGIVIPASTSPQFELRNINVAINSNVDHGRTSLSDVRTAS
jgi:hypothetical protein